MPWTFYGKLIWKWILTFFLFFCFCSFSLLYRFILGWLPRYFRWNAVSRYETSFNCNSTRIHVSLCNHIGAKLYLYQAVLWGNPRTKGRLSGNNSCYFKGFSVGVFKLFFFNANYHAKCLMVEEIALWCIKIKHCNYSVHSCIWFVTSIGLFST